MSGALEIDYACSTSAGTKAENADACGARVPKDGLLRTKGMAAAIADGMSSSEGGREASEVCITGFLTDYFSTPESWTVKTSGGKVLGAINRWLCGQGQALYDSPRGMVTTFTGLVIKSTTAHVFHVGDSRLWLYRGGELEQLTRDHRVWISKDRVFLARAIGADPHVDIDYLAQAVEVGDIFLFTTDGIHEFLTRKDILGVLDNESCHPQACANTIVAAALEHGSTDNVSCQLLRVQQLPSEDEDDIYRQVTDLPFPPDLKPGMTLDGYQILRELHASKRSEVYLAMDSETGNKVVLKTPSVNYRDDAEYLDGFLHEEWVGQRLNNPHLLKALKPKGRRFLYNITEHVEGQSLRQWMHDHPQAPVNQVRELVNQIAEGLRALHRMEMVHQDLKPENILIDDNGILKLIDFGSAKIAGVEEISTTLDRSIPQGTINYTAPEYLEGDSGTNRSDIFSLGVITYELLTGKLPFGESDQIRAGRRLRYFSAHIHNPKIPVWIDGALEKATAPNPRLRYETLSEFVYDLAHPNKAFTDRDRQPLLEKNPIAFWRGLALILVVSNLLSLYFLLRP